MKIFLKSIIPIFFIILSAQSHAETTVITHEEGAPPSTFHLVQVHLSNDLMGYFDMFAFSELNEKANLGKHSVITATNISELERKLRALDTTIPITHLAISSHGSSHSMAVYLYAGSEHIEFSSHSDPKSNPFSKLRGRFADSPKIYLSGCEVFSGDKTDAQKKAGYVAEVLGVNTGEIFGSKYLNSPAQIFLAPPLTISSFLRQALTYAMLTVPLTLGSAKSEAVLVFAIFAGVFGVALPNIHDRFKQEGYCVGLSENGTAELMSTDKYFYEAFL